MPFFEIYVQNKINSSLTKSLVRALHVQLLYSSKKKQFISRIFSHHRLLGEKRKDTWIYEDQKNAKNTSKNRLKTVDLYLRKLVKGDDVTELCLASSTRPRPRNLLAALAQYTVSHFRSSSTKLSSCSLMFAMKRMF